MPQILKSFFGTKVLFAGNYEKKPTESGAVKTHACRCFICVLRMGFLWLRSHRTRSTSQKAPCLIGTHCCKWECSHSLQATSKRLHANLCPVSCVNGALPLTQVLCLCVENGLSYLEELVHRVCVGTINVLSFEEMDSLVRSVSVPWPNVVDRVHDFSVIFTWFWKWIMRLNIFRKLKSLRTVEGGPIRTRALISAEAGECRILTNMSVGVGC